MQRRTLPRAAACALLAASAASAQTITTTPVRAPVVASKTAEAPTAKRPPLEAIPAELLGRELKDLDGQSFSFSNFRGQVMVLNIWATWCGPCRVEIPELNKLHNEYSARGVSFVSLNVENPEDDAGKVLAFVAKFEMKYPVVWLDEDSAVTLLDGRANIPQTLVIGPDGRIFKRFVGYSPTTSPKMMREAIGRALGDIE